MRRVLGVAALILGVVLAAPAAAQPERPADSSGYPRQTSDGLPGELAAPLPSLRGEPVVSNEMGYDVAPGLTYRQWDQTNARGPIRAYLLTANLDEPTLRLRYAGAQYVRRRAHLTNLLEHRGAIAGVNGDFFDIADIGAPLGVGVDRRHLLHGPVVRPNAAFVLDRTGQPQITGVRLRATIPRYPRIRITNLNSPVVDQHGVGVYTPRWGRTAGYRVVGPRHPKAREVVVRRGRVVSNRKHLSAGVVVRGRVLVGRGRGADSLRRLKVGKRVTIRTGVEGDPKVVLTSNRILLREGVVRVTDDRVLHPRTAIGIDRDGRQLFMLVIDGRQEHSRGYTMVELANMLLGLGAEDALNLDGGGSSTMVAARPDGVLEVWNSPSDGHQRPIPNGLGFVSTAP